MSACLLCQSEKNVLHARAHGRLYFTCEDCGLIFVPRRFHPSRGTERRRYETHNNDPDDPAYRAFLSRLTNPLSEVVEPPAAGLDYGSGPGPTLSVMMEEQGFRMSIYDPFFATEESVLSDRYDFITCTETAEHFHSPRAEFGRLRRLLKPGGFLGVMTKWADDRDIRRWSYARDDTHVCFYRRQTMRWIADRFRFTLDVPRRNVAIFRRID